MDFRAPLSITQLPIELVKLAAQLSGGRLKLHPDGCKFLLQCSDLSVEPV
jgi:hypothetical protein